ncbi:MAG: glycosyltransferase [Armatimonadetes bacterium]|nr:glycosyltransferase [Armatimonadota bacterium]
MRVVLAHDYLVQGIRGAERVLLEMHELWPDAPIYTLLFDPHRMGEPWTGLDIRTSFLQKLPASLKLYRKLYLLMPAAVELLRLEQCDVLVSASSAWVKNLRPPPGALHICYCYSPARFLWHQRAEYLTGLGLSRPAAALVSATLWPIRWWDKQRCSRGNAFIAISEAVRTRIQRYYGRDAVVVYPPVDVERFAQASCGNSSGDYFLVVAALNAYKRVDLAVEACTRLGVPLKVVGDGPLREQLRAMSGPKVEFLGQVPEEELPKLYAGCRAFLMPQEEDFGLAAVEAQAAGKPVLAYRAGGALETVVEGETGVLFNTQSAEELEQAIARLDTMTFSADACRKNAARFSRERFRQELTRVIEHLYSEWQAGKRGVLI